MKSTFVKFERLKMGELGVPHLHICGLIESEVGVIINLKCWLLIIVLVALMKKKSRVSLIVVTDWG